MRLNIHQLIKQCPHFQLTFFLFSWLVSSPFTIIHVDLWIPGHYTDSNGNINVRHIVVCRCRTRVNESSAILAKYFF